MSWFFKFYPQNLYIKDSTAQSFGEKYGVVAYQKPWGGSHLRLFWQYIASASTCCSNSLYFEELYDYFTTEQVLLINPIQAYYGNCMAPGIVSVNRQDLLGGK
ncbi:hypothetical protein AALP_AA5G243200 [Arabis alpina]|uniref:Uncharacterized protein n=1 Tax=Arabis alpina TaxID=50452 RepID=A0A087GZ37_ARAAL|nr:hypothetical protein AALP_AA5G243200 [Arabis alpina]